MTREDWVEVWQESEEMRSVSEIEALQALRELLTAAPEPLSVVIPHRMQIGDLIAICHSEGAFQSAARRAQKVLERHK